jgi:hypothetical protein
LGEFPVREGWKSEVVAIRPRRGQPRFLVSVRKEPCRFCANGVRTLSIWGTLGGMTEEVAWCAHCFNATCGAVDLDPDATGRLATVRQSLAEQPPLRCWDAVRPALEDLERRGLL